MEKVRKLTSAVGLVAGLFGLASLSGPALAADCPIKIGGLAPLSAPGSVTGGEAMRDAMIQRVVLRYPLFSFCSSLNLVLLGFTVTPPKKGWALLS